MSIVLLIISAMLLFYILKCRKQKELLDDIYYNLQNTEGRLPHDNMRINHCLHRLRKEIIKYVY